MSQRQRIEVGENETVDEILFGKLRIIQSQKGYRFGIDSILLADFASRYAKGLVIDLGTGCGIVALAILTMSSSCRVLGIEIQGPLVSQALRNSQLNGLEESFCVIQADIRQPPIKAGVADMVISNPPFRKVGSSLVSPDPVKAIAKNQILLSLEELISSACYLLKPKGRFCLVYPADQTVVLIQGLRRKGLEPKRLLFQHPRPDLKAELVFLEAQKGARPGIRVESPIFGQGRHSNISQG